MKLAAGSNQWLAAAICKMGLSILQISARGWFCRPAISHPETWKCLQGGQTSGHLIPVTTLCHLCPQCVHQLLLAIFLFSKSPGEKPTEKPPSDHQWPGDTATSTTATLTQWEQIAVSVSYRHKTMCNCSLNIPSLETQESKSPNVKFFVELCFREQWLLWTVAIFCHLLRTGAGDGHAQTDVDILWSLANAFPSRVGWTHISVKASLNNFQEDIYGHLVEVLIMRSELLEEKNRGQHKIKAVCFQGWNAAFSKQMSGRWQKFLSPVVNRCWIKHKIKHKDSVDFHRLLLFPHLWPHNKVQVHKCWTNRRTSLCGLLSDEHFCFQICHFRLFPTTWKMKGSFRTKRRWISWHFIQISTRFWWHKWETTCNLVASLHFWLEWRGKLVVSRPLMTQGSDPFASKVYVRVYVFWIHCVWTLVARWTHDAQTLPVSQCESSWVTSSCETTSLACGCEFQMKPCRKYWCSGTCSAPDHVEHARPCKSTRGQCEWGILITLTEWIHPSITLILIAKFKDGHKPLHPREGVSVDDLAHVVSDGWNKWAVCEYHLQIPNFCQAISTRKGSC